MGAERCAGLVRAAKYVAPDRLAVDSLCGSGCGREGSSECPVEGPDRAEPVEGPDGAEPESM